MSEEKPFFDVSACVLVDSEGRFLMAQRPEGKSWSGWWEFPGGKIEEGETPKDATIRELREELGVDLDPESTYPWVTLSYEYPKTEVLLHFFRCYKWTGKLCSLENQAFEWFTEMPTDRDLLPASVEPIEWLGLGNVYLLSNFFEDALEINSNIKPEETIFWGRLVKAIDAGVKLFQFREPKASRILKNEDLKKYFDAMLEYCHLHSTKVLVNSCHPKTWAAQADGIHLRSADALIMDIEDAPEKGLLAVSCHNMADLLYAHELGADFVVLGHVLETASHPNSEPLGWKKFEECACESAIPIFAIGGQSKETLIEAFKHGAQGIAILRGGIIE